MYHNICISQDHCNITLRGRCGPQTLAKEYTRCMSLLRASKWDVPWKCVIFVRMPSPAQVAELRGITSRISSALLPQTILSKALLAETATDFAPHEHPALAQIVALTEFKLLYSCPPCRCDGKRRRHHQRPHLLGARTVRLCVRASLARIHASLCRAAFGGFGLPYEVVRYGIGDGKIFSLRGGLLCGSSRPFRWRYAASLVGCGRSRRACRPTLGPLH